MGSSHEADTAFPVDDDELARQALAADPDVPVDPSVPPFAPGDRGAALLPEWYMPATLRSGPSSPGRRWAVGAVVLALLLVNGAGLCVTYGFPEIAW